MALTEKLSAIADAIRGKTGKSDALTLEQMATEIGGLGGGGLAYDMGEFVLDADTLTPGYVPHYLGAQPDFCVVWTDDYVGVTNPDTTYATALGFIWMNQIMGLENWYTSAAHGLGTTVHFHQNKGSSGMIVGKPNSLAYVMCADDLTGFGHCTPTEFRPVKQSNTIFYRAGVTYKYFVSRAWWNVGGVANAE